MAKKLNKSSIETGADILAHHVSQSVDALTGIEEYDITISGSLNLTGSLFIHEIDEGNSVNKDNVELLVHHNNTNKVIKKPKNSIVSLQDVTEVGNTTTNSIQITGSLNTTENIITLSNLSASGNLFASAPEGDNADYVALYNPSTGQFFYTSSEAVGGDSASTLQEVMEGGSSSSIAITSSADVAISASGDLIVSDITSSNISASGDLIVSDITSSNISASGDLMVSDITASGDISASGDLYGEQLQINSGSDNPSIITSDGKVGIGTLTPSQGDTGTYFTLIHPEDRSSDDNVNLKQRLRVKGGDKFHYCHLYGKKNKFLSMGTSILPDGDTKYGGLSMGVVGEDADSLYDGYGKDNESFIYSSKDQKGLNIIKQTVMGMDEPHQDVSINFSLFLFSIAQF